MTRDEFPGEARTGRPRGYSMGQAAQVRLARQWRPGHKRLSIRALARIHGLSKGQVERILAEDRELSRN